MEKWEEEFNKVLKEAIVNDAVTPKIFFKIAWDIQENRAKQLVDFIKDAKAFVCDETCGFVDHQDICKKANEVLKNYYKNEEKIK